MAVAAEVEGDDLLAAFGLAALGLDDRAADGVVGFGGGDDAFGLGEQDAGGEGVELMDGDRLDEALLDRGRDHRRHAVITQAAGVEAGGHEMAAELAAGFQADDGLMKQDVIEDRAEGVVGVGGLQGLLDGLADGDAERTVGIGGFGEDGAAGGGLAGGAGVDGGAPGSHHRGAVGFLIVAATGHVEVAAEAEAGAGVGERAAPLAGAGE